MSPEMYALIDATPFHLRIATKTTTPDYPDKLDVQGVSIPYTCKKKSKIDAEFLRAKNYFETWKNIYHAVYDTLDMHVNDTFKVVPATNPPTTGWNGSMLPNNIFNQLQGLYSKPMPDAMRQNNLTFLAPYNPQEPPKLLFKQCSDCQGIAIMAKVPYIGEQMMMNVINLLTRSGMFVQDLKDWDRTPSADQTWINLRSFIQEFYQQCITSRTMMSAQGGYTGGGNCFAGLTAKEDNVSDDNTAETIAGMINLHMANLSLQTVGTIEASRSQVNATLQQMAMNQAQLQQQQQQMMQQMAMMLFAPRQNAGRNTTHVPPPAATQAYAPPPWAPMPYQQGFQQPGGHFAIQQHGGRGGRSRGGRIRHAKGGGRGGIPVPMPFIGGTQMIPYILGGMQQQPQPPPKP
jgi:hypothetical protein